jgi:CPA2 family monovalent cation:H+ antiporter-2
VTGLRLAIFLVGLVVVGLLVIPRTVRMVVRMNRPETTLITSMGICFAAALLAYAFGYSVALGAFIAGSLVAESGKEATVAHLIEPVRDVFAAIFFIAVGMMIDPTLVLEHWLPVVVFTLMVIVGKVVAVTISAFFTGYGARTSLQAGMSLAQIGEFSFIIATLGLATGATRGFLYPIAVTVSAITTLSTPWFIRGSERTAAYVDAKLPRPLQTFVTLYESWIERIRQTRASRTPRPRARRLVSVLALDAIAIAVLILSGVLETSRLTVLLSGATGVSVQVAKIAVLAVIGLVAVPLLVGLFRTSRQLGTLLALEALPAVEKGVDFAAAPRRALVVTLQLAIVVVSIVVIVAVTEPFLPRIGSLLLLGPIIVLLLLVFGVMFWRTAADLHGHARAGAEIIVNVLAQQMATEPRGSAARTPPTLEKVRAALPGLGDPVSLHIPRGSPVDRRTLAEINLRGLTGATVLAIVRGDIQLLMPSGHETLHADDVLAVVGSHEAVESARALIGGNGTPAVQRSNTA